MLLEAKITFSSGEPSRRGKAGALWACGPSCAPLHPPGPPRQLPAFLVPRYGPVGFRVKPTRATSRSAIAFMLSSFGKCLHEGTACTLFCFRGKSFGSTERWADVEAVEDGAVVRKVAHVTTEA